MTAYSFGNDARQLGSTPGTAQQCRCGRPIPLVRRNPTPGGCMTCMATCGSGCRTGMQTMPGSLQWILEGPSSGSYRVIRGGGWGRRRELPVGVSLHRRLFQPPRRPWLPPARTAPNPGHFYPVTLWHFGLGGPQAPGEEPLLFSPSRRARGPRPRGPGAEPLVAGSAWRDGYCWKARTMRNPISGARSAGACAARAALRAVWTDCQEPPRTTLSAALCPTSNAPSGFGLVGDAV